MGVSKEYKAIVIGASAGGLNALSVILEKLSSDYPLPLIVVQHRGKDQRDLLEEVLQSKSRIKIKQADEKEKINPGTVYIAPPDYHLLIERDGTFSLSSDVPVNYSRPSIDVLFESAAHVYGNQLVGVILTGANSDGAGGLACIKKMGGIAIVQEPREAEYASMPNAAIAKEAATHVYTLAQIQDYIIKLAV
jgi:two-component system chemotaxis response regulator CheB